MPSQIPSPDTLCTDIPPGIPYPWIPTSPDTLSPGYSTPLYPLLRYPTPWIPHSVNQIPSPQIYLPGITYLLEYPTARYPSRQIPQAPDTLAPRYSMPRYPTPNTLPPRYPTPWKGHGTRDTLAPTPQKNLGPVIPYPAPVNRHMPVKIITFQQLRWRTVIKHNHFTPYAY